MAYQSYNITLPIIRCHYNEPRQYQNDDEVPTCFGVSGVYEQFPNNSTYTVKIILSSSSIFLGLNLIYLIHLQENRGKGEGLRL